MDHFAWWCAEHCVQSVDVHAGRRLELEEWQRGFFEEALAVDDNDDPYWKTVVLVVSRKNGKSTMLGAYATYHLDQHDGQPEVLLTASSDKQAGRLFDAVTSFTRRSPYLLGRFHIRDHVGEIARSDGGGKIHRMSSDPNRAHGWNPSLVIADELHAWETPNVRKFWTAMTTAGGARANTQVFVITTAGQSEHRETGILGQLVDRNEATGEVERRPGLTISRNHAARVLVYNYSAPVRPEDPPGEQRRDLQAIRLANPASWITDDYLAKQSADPGLTDAEFLQLHGCVWAAGRGMWLADRWDGLRSDAELPDGVEITVGVDVGLTNDTTAVAWVATVDGRAVFRARVWSAVAAFPHHEYVPGGRVRLEPVEAFILDLARRYAVRAVAYDPAFFEQSSQRLSDAGLTVFPVEQKGRPWEDATSGFYQDAIRELITHDGEPVLAAHVKSVVAEQIDRGWRLRKLRSSRKIDAAVAAVIARYAATVAPDPVMAWAEAW